MASSQKVAVTSSTNFSTSPGTQNTITAALVDAGSIATIRAAILHELQAAGWTQDLKSYVTSLMRSGELSSYNDIMDRVMEQALGSGSNQALRVPDVAVKQAIKTVKHELEKVCVVAE